MLQVGDSDTEDALRAKDAIAFLQELRCLVFGEVFKQVGVINDIKGGIGEGDALGEVMGNDGWVS